MTCARVVDDNDKFGGHANTLLLMLCLFRMLLPIHVLLSSWTVRLIVLFFGDRIQTGVSW